MDDKTKIKILWSLVGLGTVTTWANFWVARGLYKALKKMRYYNDGLAENVQDHRAYIRKILEVTEPTERQMDQINRAFDWEKWDQSMHAD